VNATGGGNGATEATPTTASSALSGASPGDLIKFAAGNYNLCMELDDSHSGTYDNPIVLQGTRDSQGGLATKVSCCATGRKSCINLESANYIAIDSFEFFGSTGTTTQEYGVRVVGTVDAPNHSVGNAILNSHSHDLYRDPFFTSYTDWFVIEGNTAERGGARDGHGIYLSNGSDFNIVRYNETNDNSNADFQINADPLSTCDEDGNYAYTDPRCDGDAKDGLGEGASDYMLVESNYFHNNRAQGPNILSVRNSIFRNNIIAFYQRGGAAFWQETNDPKLGCTNNVIDHNLLIGTNSQDLLQFYGNSGGNKVRNNVLIGVTLNGQSAVANPNTVLRATSSTSVNTYSGNMYIGGKLTQIDDSADQVGTAQPGASEFSRSNFDPAWFVSFPFDKLGSVESFKPSATAPWLDMGSVSAESPADFAATPRNSPTDLGPWERP